MPYFGRIFQHKKGYATSLYRSPSQTAHEFDLLMLNFETLLVDISNRNPHLVLINGHFNAKFRN